jgi:RimJ/RimL family protein N-acetyltransferase
MQSSVGIAAAEHGFRRLELVVYANNAAAIQLYKKFCFAQEGVFCEQSDLGGVRENIIAMIKFLD